MRDDREERVRSDTTTTEERVEMRGPGDPVAPPLGEPEVEQAVVRENEVVRQREDGTIERDTVREERRRRSRGSQIGLVLAILALLAAAAFGAWWYFTQASTTDVPAVEGMPLDRAVSTLQDDDLKAGIVTQPSDAPQGTVFRQDPTAAPRSTTARRCSCSSRAARARRPFPTLSAWTRPSRATGSWPQASR